jgi:cyclin-dependent kinase 12/13
LKKSKKEKKEKKNKVKVERDDDSSSGSSSSEDEDYEGDKNRSMVDFGPDKKVKKGEKESEKEFVKTEELSDGRRREDIKSREKGREDRPREDRGREDRRREDRSRDDKNRDEKHRDDRKRDERSIRDPSRDQNREKRGRDSREPRSASRDISKDNRHVKLSQAPEIQDEREVVSVKSEPKIIISRRKTHTPPPSKNPSSKLELKPKLEAENSITKNLPEKHPAREKLQNGGKREHSSGHSNGQNHGQSNGQSNSQSNGGQKPQKPQKSSKQKEKIDIEELMNDNVVGARRPRPGIKRESGFHDWGSGTINQYDKIKQVGEGTFGQVYKGKCKKNGDIVALKKVRLDKEREGFPITTVREVKVLRELRHQNMIALRDIITETSKDPETGKESVAFYLIFDYMDHDLIGLLDSGMVSFGQNEIMRLMYQLIDALAYCHDRNFMHRDIKPSNILIDNKGTVKVADFGLARLFDDQDRLYTNRVITLWYRPPELLLGQERYTTAVDVWSCGCILAELFIKKPIFQAQTEIDQLEKISKICGSPKPTVWPDVCDLPLYEQAFQLKQYERRLRQEYAALPDDALDLLDKMLTLDPNQRLTCDKAMHHRWFKSITQENQDKDASLSIKLPQEVDCHEMWSKERKKARRTGGHKSNIPIFEPLANQAAGSKTPEAFGAGAQRGHSVPGFPGQHRQEMMQGGGNQGMMHQQQQQPINPSLDCRNHRNLNPTTITYAQICQKHPNLTVLDFLAKIGVQPDLKPYQVKQLNSVTIEQLLIGKHISALPELLGKMGVSLQ